MILWALYNVQYDEILYQLPCSWLGTMEQCSTNNWECDHVKENGFSASMERGGVFSEMICSITQFMRYLWG